MKCRRPSALHCGSITDSPSPPATCRQGQAGSKMTQTGRTAAIGHIVRSTVTRVATKQAGSRWAFRKCPAAKMLHYLELAGQGAVCRHISHPQLQQGMAPPSLY